MTVVAQRVDGGYTLAEEGGPRLVTVQEAAGILGISEKTVRRRTKSKRLKARKVREGRAWRWAVERDEKLQGAPEAEPLLVDLMEMIRRKDDQTSELQETIALLSGQAGYLRAQVDEMKLLTAGRQPWWVRLLGRGREEEPAA